MIVWSPVAKHLFLDMIFGLQPGSDAEVASFCALKGVKDATVFSKVSMGIVRCYVYVCVYLHIYDYWM